MYSTSAAEPRRATVTRGRLSVLLLLALTLFGLWQVSRPIPQSKRSQPGGDINLFRAVVHRVAAGEPYYTAMRAELIPRGYPTASVLNWRPPLVFIGLARYPGLMHAIMIALAVIALAMTAFAFRNSPPAVLVMAVGLQIGASLFPAIPKDGLYMPETWAGMFLLLSVLAYTVGANRAGVACAIAAACARELALPYVLAGSALALRARRFDEVRWYMAGLLVFAAYYAGHAAVAGSHIQAGDMFHTASWVAFGGWQFVIRTVAMGGWYLMLPLWSAAIGVVLVVASLWGPADHHLKAMVIIYLAAFSIVGQTFNTYWGLMTGPAWGLATVYGVMGLHALIRGSGRDFLDGHRSHAR